MSILETASDIPHRPVRMKDRKSNRPTDGLYQRFGSGLRRTKSLVVSLQKKVFYSNFCGISGVVVIVTVVVTVIAVVIIIDFVIIIVVVIANVIVDCIQVCGSIWILVPLLLVLSKCSTNTNHSPSIPTRVEALLPLPQPCTC